MALFNTLLQHQPSIQTDSFDFTLAPAYTPTFLHDLREAPFSAPSSINPPAELYAQIIGPPGSNIRRFLDSRWELAAQTVRGIAFRVNNENQARQLNILDSLRAYLESGESYSFEFVLTSPANPDAFITVTGLATGVVRNEAPSGSGSYVTVLTIGDSPIPSATGSTEVSDSTSIETMSNQNWKLTFSRGNAPSFGAIKFIWARIVDETENVGFALSGSASRTRNLSVIIRYDESLNIRDRITYRGNFYFIDQISIVERFRTMRLELSTEG